MALYTIETYGELQPHDTQEWLLTNGLGGYASSTVVGCNSRRYHGLLVAATLPPVGRIMTVNRIGEIISLDGRDDQLLEFSINAFGPRLHPRGDRYLRRFDLDDSIRWEYQIDGVQVIKELQMPWLKNVAGVRYSVQAAPGRRVRLQLLPFVSLRDFHGLRRGNNSLGVEAAARHVRVFDGDKQVFITADTGNFETRGDWWYGQTYALETERGLDDTEDLYTPGRFVLDLTGSATITLWLSIDSPTQLDWDSELGRRRTAIAKTRRAEEHRAAATPKMRRMLHAANDFVVYRKSPDGSSGTSVIAGYPWFADWGRDTMISLPGLFLIPGRFEQACQVLSVFAQYVSEGMIPNRFDDYTNEPSYNTVDASLWFIHAVFEYRRLSGDAKTFDAALRPACSAIIEGYRNGTRFKIAMDPADGLITQGDASTQLTWMDAKYQGVVFTPRQGKAVEINALWYHALVLMEERELAEKVADSFRKAFWISPFRGLYDVVDGGQKDASIRPNQIFAASLPNSPLTADQQSAVVEVVRRELLTPMGLRTLSRSDPKFKPYYRGPQSQRDAAYHNGTVWTWPLGAFLDAYLRVNNQSDPAKEQARQWLHPLLDHMNSNGCIGQISEIFEAEPPHRPVGCCAQAWSVAEVLRLASELGM